MWVNWIYDGKIIYANILGEEKMANKHDQYYYDAFVRLVDYSVKAAQFLNEMVHDFHPELLRIKKDEVHTIEHEADQEKYKVTEYLVKEFLPPLDREDIVLILRNIDDLTDAIEEVVLKMYMYNIRSMKEISPVFTKLILQCTIALKDFIMEFQNFKKSKTLRELLQKVSQIEIECDHVYVDAVRELFEYETDSVELMIWHEIFDLFEHCCDECLEVASTFELAYMKHI